MSTDRMIQEFCHLVEIDSPSFGERAMADYLTGRLTELGFVVEEDQAGAFYGGTAGNLYAHREGSRQGRSPSVLHAYGYCGAFPAQEGNRALGRAYHLTGRYGAGGG